MTLSLTLVGATHSSVVLFEFSRFREDVGNVGGAEKERDGHTPGWEEA